MDFLSKLAVAISISLMSLTAGLVDGISVVINNEPITLYEIYKYSQKFNISKKKALDILIRQRLEDAQIKKLKIDVAYYEIENYIDNLARKNGMSVFDFFEMLRAKGIDEDEYKKDLKTKMKRDKLYKRILSSKLNDELNEKELKSYYERNIQQFTVAREFEVISYRAKDRDALERIKTNPMLASGVKAKEQIFKSGRIDPKIESLLNSMKPDSFTRIFPIKDGYSMFYLKKKIGLNTMPFQKVKNYIYSALKAEKESSIMENYFEKLKADADITILRKP
jgi:parvulin-like peptidyl-prolyl isomerase